MNRAERRRSAREERRPPTPVPAAPRDDRIVYGARCVWWDSIDKVGTLPGSGLPCSPHCQSVLYETSPADWWAGVDEHDASNPGYRKLVEWMRGRCFPSYVDAEAAYTAAHEGC